MHRTLLAAFIASLLSSCGQLSPGASSPHIESAVQPYYAEFITDASLHKTVLASEIVNSIQIVFQGLPFPVVGRCTTDINTYWTIYIDKIYWDSASDLSKKILVYHELGHCILYRAHRNDLDTQDNEPYSLMNSSMVPDSVVNQSQRVYAGFIDELFTRFGDLNGTLSNDQVDN